MIWGIRRYLVDRATMTVFRLILGHVWRIAGVWADCLTISRLLCRVRRARPPIHSISLILNTDWLPTVTLIIRRTVLHLLRWWSWVLRADFVVTGRWIWSSIRSSLGRVAILRLKRDWCFGVGTARFLPGATHGVSFTNESTSQAVVAYWSGQKAILKLEGNEARCNAL